MKKRIFLILSILIFLIMLPSCDDGTDISYRVMVSAGEGASVTSANPVTVRPGESAVFNIEIDSAYAFYSSSFGEYDPESGTLTVKSVNRPMNISFFAEYLGYESGREVVYRFKGERRDVSSIDGNYVGLGSRVSLSAKNKEKIFLGWSFGRSGDAGGEIVSTERDFSFRVSPDILHNGVMYVFANYMDKSTNVYMYDANGGYIEDGTRNTEENGYYKVERQDGERLLVTLFESYYSFARSASTFYDDGTFRKDGFVLVEYNTKADGTGEAYSPGSKFFAKTDEDIATLYCIWKKAAPESELLYSDISVGGPVGVAGSGIIIESYLGDAEEIVIPETVDGKPVIALAAGAIRNKSASSLVLPRTLVKVADGAIRACPNIETVYYPDGIYHISDQAFDSESYSSLGRLIVRATIAPRYAKTSDGAFAVKLSRLLETKGQRRVIVIAGSSTYEGLAGEYMKALFDGEIEVINFGTTRTTHGLIYLEAMSSLAGEEDLIIYAPENSSYMMGERELYWKSLRDLEGMNNFFRYIDISNYTRVFSAFAEYNELRYARAECRYEDIATVTATNALGEFQNENRKSFDYPNYTDSYFITMNEYYKSKDEGAWNNVSNQTQNKDYTDPTNKTWQKISEESFVSLVCHAVSAAKSSGATVAFGFAPAEAGAVVSESQSAEALMRYDALIRELYNFDLIIGESRDYIFARKYFYDCAYHLNDFGRTYRTYQLYLDIAPILGFSGEKGITDEGVDFEGCEFEHGLDTEAPDPISWLQ